ncbi:MAG TPA: hypothetical protein VK025_06390, partial [Steroidobacter sp.]|nr:hypothetical protein [Steroidobacter sp.]
CTAADLYRQNLPLAPDGMHDRVGPLRLTRKSSAHRQKRYYREKSGLGAAAVWIAEPLMPWTLGFAAGAMLFVISDEIIPETHRGGYEDTATFSLLGGFAVMMFLDSVFA